MNEQAFKTELENNTPLSHHCQVCDFPQLVELAGFNSLPRITSDCRPFRSGGKLVICDQCGTVQKYPDATWLQEIGEIYAGYAAYYQGDGDEQVVLDSRTGLVRRRSDVILEQLIRSHQLAFTGKALDIGCGTGVTLRAVSKVLSDWQFFGQDLDRRNYEKLASIPGFTQLFNCDPSQIEGEFDLITLIHSLEHFPAPGILLKQLREKLSPNGILLVQVCDSARNPYDLLIADHLMHFTADTLKLLAKNSGYSVDAVETTWINKELSMIARKNSAEPIPFINKSLVNTESAKLRVKTQLGWLAAIAQEATRTAKESDSFGIFGSSICATWLADILGDKVAFFVDEDPSRQGKEFRGKPVFSPKQAPHNSDVYMALVPDIAARISERLQTRSLRLIQPPSFNFS